MDMDAPKEQKQNTLFKILFFKVEIFENKLTVESLYKFMNDYEM